MFEVLEVLEGLAGELACGVMADGRAYIRDNVPFGKMAGNYGPDSKMDTAIAAYTPNTAWAEINCEAIVDMY